jgi:hypothetical protein
MKKPALIASMAALLFSASSAYAQPPREAPRWHVQCRAASQTAFDFAQRACVRSADRQQCVARARTNHEERLAECEARYRAMLQGR